LSLSKKQKPREMPKDGGRLEGFRGLLMGPKLIHLWGVVGKSSSSQ
jgi:hypothetical protein